MSAKKDSVADYSGEGTDKQEPIYFCEQHGAMNKQTDLKDKADQLAE